MTQIDLFDEIIVDNFAGGGGASTGIELATGRPVDIAINHDPDAILLHRTNHPYTTHYQESVWNVDPVEVCKGRKVGLAWFSPDCKHFSKAKGAALVDRNIRGLAWIVLRWAGTVRPRVILLENVEEFQTWGPVRKGKPIKSKSGITFRKWKHQLEDLGYKVEHRELVAADFGAPTTRKRFVLVARCDGKPIVWPERTHAPRNHPLVKAGKLKPWRSAAEIIDWSLPAYSIFESKEEIKEEYGATVLRPLADNTMRRIIRGVDKYTIKSGEPFIVQQKFKNVPQSIKEPLYTVTAVGAHSVAMPIMTPVTLSNTGGSVGSDAGSPVHTVRTAGGQMLSSAQIIQYHSEQSGHVRAQGLEAPINTVDGSNRYGLAAAQLVEYYGNGNPLDITEPLHTEIVRYDGGQDLKHWPEIRRLLNKYCGYALRNNEVILLFIGGAAWYIGDITLRMLVPRELYNAMGAPADYKIETDYTGKSYPKSKQVARCGNMVCPPLAEAMVRANLPEWCSRKISTMAELESMVAV